MNKKMLLQKKFNTGFLNNASGVSLDLRGCFPNKNLKPCIYGNSIQDGTPTPTNPVEIQSLGDKTKNIVDISKIEVGKTLIGGGTVGTNYFLETNLLRATITLKIKPNTVYSMSIKEGFYVHRAAEFKNDLTYMLVDNQFYWNTGVTPFTFTSNIQTNSFSISIKKVDGTNITMQDCIDSLLQLEEGNTTTDYEPYGYKILVKNRGKNYLYFNGINRTLSNVNFSTTTNSLKIVGLCAGNTGYYTAADNLGISTGDYKIKFYNLPKKNITFNIYNSENSLLTYFACNSNTSTEREITLTNKNINKIICYISKLGTEYNEEIICQIEKNNTSTNFEPYREPITSNIYLNAPLRKINDVADYIDFESGKVIRPISYTDDVVNLMNNLIYTTNANYNYCLLQTAKLNSIRETGNNAMVNNFHYGGDLPRWSYANASYFSFIFEKTIDTLEKAKEILANTNMIYILATPIEEQIDLFDLKTVKGTNIIELDTSIQPSNMNCSYRSKMKG